MPAAGNTVARLDPAIIIVHVHVGQGRLEYQCAAIIGRGQLETVMLARALVFKQTGRLESDDGAEADNARHLLGGRAVAMAEVDVRLATEPGFQREFREPGGPVGWVGDSRPDCFNWVRQRPGIGNCRVSVLVGAIHAECCRGSILVLVHSSVPIWLR